MATADNLRQSSLIWVDVQDEYLHPGLKKIYFLQIKGIDAASVDSATTFGSRNGCGL